jgi:hypothetical protein
LLSQIHFSSQQKQKGNKEYILAASNYFSIACIASVNKEKIDISIWDFLT